MTLVILQKVQTKPTKQTFNMSTTEKLLELLKQLPGIGPRQAGRFLHFLLLRGKEWRKEFVHLVQQLDDTTAQCSTCMRFFENSDIKNTAKCSICKNVERDITQLMVVVHDVDLKQVEKGGQYKGLYFVLGALLPLSNNRKSFARSKELLKLIKNTQSTLKEVIFALPATTDGEHTTDTLEKEIKNIVENKDIKISILGRGLSTGSEIEYADPETINSALKNRT